MTTITLSNGLQFIVEETTVNETQADKDIKNINSFCYIAKKRQ